MRFNGLAVAVVALFVFVSTPPAKAGFELTLSDGLGGSVTLNSVTGCSASLGTSGCGGAFINSADGTATWIGYIGTFLLNVTTGITKPTLTHMDLNSVNVQAGATGGNLTVTWSDTDWAGVGDFQMNAGGTMYGGTATYQAYYDSSNTLSAQTTLIGSMGPFNNGAFSGVLPGGISPGGTYSLTQKLTYAFGSWGVTSGNYELMTTAVPESASVAFIGASLLLAYEALRRRFRRG